MNKKRFVISFFSIVLVIFFTFLTTEKTMSETKSSIAKPQYEITVKQLGKEVGKIVIELFPEIAPKHCANFDSLVKVKFYDGLAFHRVIPGFMIQGGDPNSKSGPRETWGYGAPGQTKVPAEFNSTSHKRGIISAARSNDPNSASSQFFICVADSPFLDNKYTVYGHVLTGMEVVDKIVNLPKEPSKNPNQPSSMPKDKVEMFIKKIK